MSTSKHVLVIGATGQQGGAVVQALLARGHRVRGLTRNADSASAKALEAQGVEIAVGDFTDPEALARAATGVDAMFAMTTPFEQGVEVETAQGLALIQAAQQAGVGHLVYSSVGSADHNTGIPHFDSKYAVEQAIIESGLPHTIIAPVFFMDNLFQPWMAQPGKVSLAMPASQPLQHVAVADIGAFAAAVIERGEAVFGKRFDLAGEELTGEELVAQLSAAAGEPIRYEGFPVAYLREQSEDMALMFEWFVTTGYSADIAGLRRDFPEVAWHSFADWAQEQDWQALRTESAATA